MKLINLLKNFIFLTTGLQVIQGAQAMDKDISLCTKPCVRKEIREMTPDEFINFIEAFKKVKESGFWDELTGIHFKYSGYAHSTPIFLPYHRFFLEKMEKEMQKYYPGLCMPYWNWALDCENPAESIVFTSAYFGGNGVWPRYEVTTGPFSNMTIPYPKPGKLKRKFDMGSTINSFLNPKDLMMIINNAKTYSEFNDEISLGPHIGVHDNIGNGEDYIHISSKASPGDPIFFLHHCFLDMLWWNWQKKMGAIGLTYDGFNANKFDLIFPWDEPVYKVLNTTTYGTCYVYPDYNVKLPTSVEVPLEDILNGNQNSANKISMLSAKKVEKIPLNNFIKLVSNKKIVNKSVTKDGHKIKEKPHTLKKPSSNILKMFNIDPEDESRQRENFDLINESLDIAKGFKINTE